MRINLNYGLPELPESGRTEKQNTPATSGAATNLSAANASSGEDEAMLSGSHTQVQTLTAQVLQLPEVRQQRVQALRQAVENGSYNPSPDDVAGALVVQLAGEQAA
jgi:flagellar biosynthesis anti-sigma factor FlgM